jgi:UDP-N-acetylmuramyl pentapeptide synthase
MKEKTRKINSNEKAENKNVKLKKFLRFMASAILRKYHPRIIAVTGSEGETSAKKAIFTVISGRYFTRKSEKNYNDEIGVFLTIIGAKIERGSFFGWLGIFFRWLFVLIFPVKYPEVLILEMATDRPGNLKYLIDFVVPVISVITEVVVSHSEYFRNIEAVFKEKSAIARALPEKGLVILNSDNLSLAKLKDNPRQFGVTARIFSFGFLENADARAMDVFLNYREDDGVAPKKEINGLSFKLNHKGTTMPLRLNNILDEKDIYAALAGVSVGIELGLNLVEVAKSLESFSLPSK